MVRYDPNVSPDPAAWQALDEGAALAIVERHHRRADCAHPPAPNPRLHAVMHVIVENQIAMGDELPVATLRRLMAEGLTRHEAVHAIGSVAAERIYTILRERGKGITTDDAAALRRLSAESWRRSGSGDADVEESETAVVDGGKGPANPDDIVVPYIAKVRRNDPCPCGSGKKYKKCCLQRAND